ncbi:MAG: hypothetical protein EPN45_21045 [Rhizobiaceae bacterium]|nr:MAG: hypothetical protein EPN45_21045 [Rhizobiaceae bacterium]
MTTDPRAADTLDEAARDPDGMYNGARALSWLSAVLTGGNGMSEDEVRATFAGAKAKRADECNANC